MENSSERSTYSRTRGFLGHVGDWLGCHQMPERSFFIGGRQLPVCARCTGVIAGQLLCVALLGFGIHLPVFVALILALVMFVDWALQYLSVAESTNKRRLVTGVFGGFGYVTVLFTVIRALIEMTGWH